MKLGITEDQLKAAFENSNPPDPALAAKNLGLTVAELLDALGIPARP